ncbi:MAG: hypothetical protein H7Y42_06310 [Chitinophagaceae bacterium]|nr:hypothetical protein [Chitinophagaceae bacterium]
MKKYSRTLLTAVIVSLIAFACNAQEKSSNVSTHPKWVSDKGYWVVESNIKTPKDQIIRFYNNDHVLIYKETVKGVRLNLQKRQVKMKLKKVLETSVVAWELRKTPEEEKEYVARML